MKWVPFPMLRIAGFFIGGILFSIYQPDCISPNVAVVLPITLALVYFIIYFIEGIKTLPVLLGFIGLSAIFLFGYARLYLQNDLRKKDHISKIVEPINAYEAVVRSIPQEKEKSWKVEAELVMVKSDTGQWLPVTGNLLLYISKDEPLASVLKYGDQILVKGCPQELKPPANPGEFDFKRFLSFKNIFYQHFARKSEVQFVAPVQRKGFIYYSHQARAWSLSKLSKYISGRSEQAVASALVLGVTDAIDDDIINAYAASGALHVLAVSGMHVGIIYAIILYLFKPVEKIKRNKWLVAIVSLLLMWSFAFVTGLSPSVLRAVAMFSFIALARPFSIRTNIYNTLAASAFVLLLYNPYLIMSVGFQLSYLAVAGIVYLQRPIYSVWSIQNRVGDWIWQITCVSIAAQLGTFALGLLYFHQFPTYFLISNLFVIPLSTFVLVAGILLLAVSFISPVANVVGVVLEWLIKLLNGIVFKTESLPLSLINNIHLTVFQCWLLFGILIGLILLIEYKNIRWLYFSFLVTIIFSITQWNHFYENVKAQQFISYSINQHQAAEFIVNGYSYFLCDSSISADAERIRFHIQPNRLIHGIANTSEGIPFVKRINGVSYFVWNGKTIAWISTKNYQIPINFKIDFLLVSHNGLSRKSLEQLSTAKVIFDGSNTIRYVQAMDQLLKQQSIDVYSTQKNGAFIL